MILSEEFDFKKTLKMDSNHTDITVHIDISTESDEGVKVDKAIRGFLGFLTHCNYDEEHMYDTIKAIVTSVDDHPDADSFALDSAIEDAVNNEKELTKFIETVKASEDMELLREVYRCWVILHMKKKD